LSLKFTEVPARISAGTSTIITDVSVQSNTGIVSHIRPRVLPSTSFPVNQSLIALQFGATGVQCGLLTESSSKKVVPVFN
jgi:hypothetical protein